MHMDIDQGRRRNNWFVLFAKNDYIDEVEEDDMGEACSTKEGKEEIV
jgi:hypothetical protein